MEWDGKSARKWLLCRRGPQARRWVRYIARLYRPGRVRKYVSLFPIVVAKMFSPYSSLVPAITLLVFGGLLLLTVTSGHVPHEVPQTSLDAAFASQFDGLQRLSLSLLRSPPRIQNLRVDSVALEDLSYALTAALAGFPNNDMRQQIYILSQEVDTVAALMQRLYVEVDLFIHL